MKFTKVPISPGLEQAYISPDGRFMALIVREKGKTSLRLRQVGSVVEREVVTPGAGYFLHGGLTFSPDGSNIYYVFGAPGKVLRYLYRVSVLGGDPQKLIDDVDTGVAVSPEGTRLAFRRHLPSSREDTLVVANADGTNEQVIATRKAPSVFGKPEWSPTGDMLGHFVFNKDEQGDFATLETSGNRQLTFTADRHEHEPALSSDGRHIVFTTFHSGLRSISRIGIDGGGVKELVRNVGEHSEPHLSPDGQFVYYNSRDETGSTAFWKVPFDGGEPVKAREKSSCRLSRDGKWIACAHRDPTPDAVNKLLIITAAYGTVVRTLDWPSDAQALYWSHDAQALDFIADREGVQNVYRVTIATGKEQRLTDWQTPAVLWYFASSNDGRQLAVIRDANTAELLLIQNFR